MLHSSCLCGAVSWDVGEELKFMSFCHCSRCRKTRGSAFATVVAAAADTFVLRGSQNVTRFASSSELTRCFCARCGSVVPGEPWQGLVVVPAGAFDDDPAVRPSSHIFVGSKAPWYDISDALPQFETYPPRFESTELAELSRDTSTGTASGSCLCGKVLFELTTSPVLSHSCHCSRCRKASGTAHNSVAATAADGLRFLQGEELAVHFKLPEANFFSQNFCRACGSKLPRVDRDRDFAILPLGAFDNDPGIRPMAHIYVASKAPWFEIHDDLPQYAEHYRQLSR